MLQSQLYLGWMGIRVCNEGLRLLVPTPTEGLAAWPGHWEEDPDSWTDLPTDGSGFPGTQG